MSITLNPAFRYRMPIVFGPAPGPRQKPGGGMWTLEETGRMNAEWMAVTYRTDPEKLDALLPPGMALRESPWLQSPAPGSRISTGSPGVATASSSSTFRPPIAARRKHSRAHSVRCCGRVHPMPS